MLRVQPFGSDASLMHDAISTMMRNKMEAGENDLVFFLCLQCHTLWTYLGIILIKIDTYDVYSIQLTR